MGCAATSRPLEDPPSLSLVPVGPPPPPIPAQSPSTPPFWRAHAASTYRLRYPSDWIVRTRATGGRERDLFYPTRYRARFNPKLYIITQALQNFNGSAFSSDSVQGLPGLETVDPITFLGAPCLHYVQKNPVEEEIAQHFLKVETYRIVIPGNKILEVVTVVTEDDLPHWGPVLSEIRHSLQILKQPQARGQDSTQSKTYN